MKFYGYVAGLLIAMVCITIHGAALSLDQMVARIAQLEKENADLSFLLQESEKKHKDSQNEHAQFVLDRVKDSIAAASEKKRKKSRERSFLTIVTGSLQSDRVTGSLNSGADESLLPIDLANIFHTKRLRISRARALITQQ